MPSTSPIADYGDALARELAFDAALSRRVRAEIEDHLWEAARDAAGDTLMERQRQAVAKVGDPRDLALQYAASSLGRNLRRAGTTLVLAVAASYVAMKGRVAWYVLLQWEASRELKLATAIGVPVIRIAFLAAVGIALLGWAYAATRRAPARFHVGYGKEFRRCMALCGATAAALVLSVAMETVLTGIRLWETRWSAASWIPALTMATEAAAAGLLIHRIVAMVRHWARATALLTSSPAQ